MKNKVIASSLALMVGMMWSGMASATLLSSTATSTPAPLTVPTPSGANLSVVAASCAAPHLPATHRSFYVNPATGNINNPGSITQPWDTLANVIAHKQSTFQPGDVIYLYNGNHGNSYISKVNSDFVMVTAAPGQVPVVGATQIVGAKWIFSGLKFQSQRTSSIGTLVSIRSGANNIIVTGNTMSSQDNVSGWVPANWNALGVSSISVDGRDNTNCITVSNNSIYNSSNPVGLFADNTLFYGNTINNFAGDAIDYGANNLLIAHNTITNINDLGTGQHYDGMQGFTPGGTGYPSQANYTNVTIDSNTVIRQTAPLQYPSYIQGIDAFDEDWTNLTVTNNVVITNAYQGLSFASVHGGLIANNTVLADGATTTNLYNAGGTSGIIEDTSKGQEVWIQVSDKTHEGSSSNNVIVRNNISQSLFINTNASTITVDHNMVSYDWIEYSPTSPYGSQNYTAGNYGTNNTLNTALSSGFVAFDPATYSYDLRLKAGSPAIGSGISAKAPSQDIMGATRTAPIDLGAYAYQKPLAYNGSFTMVSNARQEGGSPKFSVSLDGKFLGTVTVTADPHIGQVGTYTVNFSSAAKPQKLDVTLNGYTNVVQKNISATIFNATFKENKDAAKDFLWPTAQATVKSGQVVLGKDQASYFTNGSTVEFDVSKM